MQLLGPTVFLKSVSINIITLCSRHHWIFYCNVPQNITPTLNATQKKVLLSDRNFLFWLKGFCEVCFICGSFCVFFVVFSLLSFRKSARPLFDKVTEGILFLVGHLLLTLSRNRTRYAAHRSASFKPAAVISRKKCVLRVCRLNSLLQPPHCIWLWYFYCQWKIGLFCEKQNTEMHLKKFSIMKDGSY